MENTIRLSSCLVLLSLLYFGSAITAPAWAEDPLPLPSKYSSPWYQSFTAGEAALQKNDTATAKRHWIAALDQLEKTPNPKQQDPFFGVRLGVLEERLTLSYPEDWSKAPGDEESKLSLRKEQVDVLNRISRLNDVLLPGKNLLKEKSKERYLQAEAALKKEEEAATNRPKQ